MHRASVPFSILVLFCVLGVALADSPPDRSDRGMTGEPSPLQPSPGPAIDGTDRTVAVPRGAPRPESDGRTEATTDPAWELIVEEPVWQRIDVGERFAVRFEMSSETLTPLGAADPLTVLARQAVDRAPSWLWTQLEDQFSRMSASEQDTWATLILDAVDPYVDETAFLVAHISRDDLAHAWFDAGLITDAATYPYEVDGFLDYVEVTDHGSAAEGGDYFTTLVYQVELDEVVSTVEYPKELYYWYVIHPRGSDERPAYINPAVCSSGGDPASPPTGKFWQRMYFYENDNKHGGLCDTDWDGAKDDPCPVMKDMLAGIPVLWKHLNNTNGEANGAVGVVNDWARKSLGKFGDADGCRPVQPVQVYYHNDGACGEWADLTMAAGRAALIPTEVTGARGNDHVWNEFYDQQWGRWVQWEPVNNMINSGYGGWWGGLLFTTNTYRGDGYCHSDLTSMHSDTATLTVTAYDANHYPLEGAEVTLEYDVLGGIIFWTLNVAHTDENGEAVFTIGDDRDYYVSVSTDWGSSGRYFVVDDAVPDTDYYWSPPDFGGAVPRLNVGNDSSSGTLDDYLLEAEVDVVEGYIHGAEGMMSGLGYTKETPGDVDTFVVDQANWDLFVADSAFDAFDLSLNDTGREVGFVPPVTGDWYVAWSNKASVNLSHVVRGSVRLYRNTGAVPPVTQLMVDKDVESASMLDWEDVAGQNVDGYNVYRSTTAADVGSGKTEAELNPFLLDFTAVSDYRDPEVPAAGTCFYYSIRTHSKRGGISE